MEALYISPYLSTEEFGGSKVAVSNLMLLREVFSGKVMEVAVARSPRPHALAIPTTKNKLGTGLANLQGLAGTLSRRGQACLRDLIARERPRLIWLDSSVLGCLIPFIRKASPLTKVICFFHNTEIDLVGKRIASMKPHYLPALFAIWLNERRSARESDVTIALHDSDSRRITSLYGRSVDYILPVILADGMELSTTPNSEATFRQSYVLFVGSATPPNIEALRFLCEEVAPLLRKSRILAIGSGMDRVAKRYPHPRLEIRGFVSNLADVYARAAAVVAPIFSGGGMKVKIAEGLMHAKTVVATPFAAVGYERCDPRSIMLAFDAASFATHIDALAMNRANNFARHDYDEMFSLHAGLSRMRMIISRLQLSEY